MADNTKQTSFRPYRPRAAAERHRAANQPTLSGTPAAEQEGADTSHTDDGLQSETKQAAKAQAA